MEAYDVFISYRRAGGESLACLIAERLRRQEVRVFYDVESLRSGKFNEMIFRVIEKCADVIVVLPPNSLDRCRDPEDWVRKEVAFAIAKGKNIIPVIMRGFEFPEDLPEEIAELKNFNGITANMEYFDASFQKLMSMLKSNRSSLLDRLKTLGLPEALRSDLERICGENPDVHTQEERGNRMAGLYQSIRDYLKLETAADPELIRELDLERVKLYKENATAGDLTAQVCLGEMYLSGDGVERDIMQAQSWFSAAAERGNERAQYCLNRLYSSCADELALFWLRKSAAQGYGPALLALGEHYEKRYLHATDKKKAENHYRNAVKFYNAAVNAGCTEAMERTDEKYWRRKKIERLWTS